MAHFLYRICLEGQKPCRFPIFSGSENGSRHGYFLLFVVSTVNISKKTHETVVLVAGHSGFNQLKFRIMAQFTPSFFKTLWKLLRNPPSKLSRGTG